VQFSVVPLTLPPFEQFNAVGLQTSATAHVGPLNPSSQIHLHCNLAEIRNPPFRQISEHGSHTSGVAQYRSFVALGFFNITSSASHTVHGLQTASVAPWHRMAAKVPLWHVVHAVQLPGSSTLHAVDKYSPTLHVWQQVDWEARGLV
jgi:hypothetical protein